MLEAAVNGNNSFETVKSVTFCKTLLELGFKVSEVPEIPVLDSSRINDKYADHIAAYIAEAKDHVNDLIEKLSQKYAPVFGEHRHLRNAMNIALSDFIEYCDDESDSCVNHFADALQHIDTYSDLAKYEKLLLKIDSAIANKIALEEERESELDAAQEAKWRAELESVDDFHVDDDLPESLQISSQYKKFIIKWAWDESLAEKEFEDDFCGPWLCWISDQSGQYFLADIFTKIEQQVNSGKKSVKFFLHESDGGWEISNEESECIQSPPFSLLAEILAMYGYHVAKTDVNEKTEQIIVNW